MRPLLISTTPQMLVAHDLCAAVLAGVGVTWVNLRLSRGSILRPHATPFDARAISCGAVVLGDRGSPVLGEAPSFPRPEAATIVNSLTLLTETAPVFSTLLPMLIDIDPNASWNHPVAHRCRCGQVTRRVW